MEGLYIVKQISKSQRAILKNMISSNSLEYSDDLSLKISEDIQPQEEPVIPRISMKKPYLKKGNSKHAADNSDLISILTQ